MRLVAVLVAAALVGGCSAGDDQSPEKPSTAKPIGSPTASASASVAGGPLAGKVIVLDPGHQLGNARFPREIDEPVDAGGFEKECNTTGTATNRGYPEATFVWQLAREVRRQLRRLGARVVLTRSTNSDAHWGPCVDERGRAGNPDRPGPTADVKLSLHADGLHDAGAHGFHVIRPGRLPGYTDDIAGASRVLALAVRDALVRARFQPSSYRGTRGLDVRTDLGTLNLSDVPVVLVELGNMRNAAEAAVMSSAAGRDRYARALVRGVRAYLAG
ncbi:N-acetylmuramoyl-L-alanine amidase [Nocardioides sp.]|nr:N-acetylmuramoyl-L-alanine amidase [Nocardioides sp.]